MEKKQIKISLIQALTIAFIIIAIIIAVIGAYILKGPKENNNNIALGKVDDWKYSNSDYSSYYNYSLSSSINSAGIVGVNVQSDTASIAGKSAVSEATIGLSTGGAKDINNFR